MSTQVTRIDAYKILFEKKDSGEDVSKYLDAMTKSSSSQVPLEVLEFLGYIKKEPTAFEEFAELLRSKSNNKKSKLYKELLNDKATIDDQVKSLSSYITNVLIACEKLEDEDTRVDLWNSSSISQVANALSMYFSTADSKIIEDMINNIRQKLIDCKSNKEMSE